MGVYTVTGLNNYIKNVLTSEGALQHIWVEGEISNLTKHRSGHYYFSIKDGSSQVSCVSFRSTNRKLKFEPEKDMKVLVFGSVNVYTIRGQYQLQVLDIRPDGVGELYKAFEQLKKRLEGEGLFAPEHKRPLPRYPLKIGVATSATGAAIHDILHVLQRRYPVDILLCPTTVQGEASADSIIRSLELLNRTDADLIIAGRGGGSLEDLWPFNEEKVARAIYNSRIPVIAAVGHETDFTISDFAADVRAPTPSAAAEIAVPDRTEIVKHIDDLRQRMESALKNRILNQKKHLEYLSGRISPDRYRELLNQRSQHLDEMTYRLTSRTEYIMQTKVAELGALAGRLNAVSPLNTLERGYCVAQSDEGGTITGIIDIEMGESLQLKFWDGCCRVKHKENLDEGC
ncbi:exodeoxyribonuclease VII large subunit [Methanohalophilus halophilus]|uniref:Exodeoxyribonuclease VII large subunit n=1 Tax=Methanohalophilus halophilus TaxID=2177 RepID=A0A1L3Q1W4_9EURY|nr:exodeoxyribonuclease VII large subunit [Methanohalophilus halophilus]APH38857.1 exodeoxyribonuclease VII large subunit [Methanohalophilus halophilus]RNI07517.1 exodeoxyribonuclease VII large subunit [Methanohalophilus halophilus]SDW69450.1 Exodeoxyribonuclease VII large subunit [Methanohalophilus halophilus]